MVSWSWLQVRGWGSHDSHGILLAVYVYIAILQTESGDGPGASRRPCWSARRTYDPVYGPPQAEKILLTKLEDTPPVSPKRTLQQVLKAQKGIKENAPGKTSGFPDFQSTSQQAKPCKGGDWNTTSSAVWEEPDLEPPELVTSSCSRRSSSRQAMLCLSARPRSKVERQPALHLRSRPVHTDSIPILTHITGVPQSQG